MLFGAVGRTDLISPADTEPLTRAQYRSVRRLAAELPDQVAVYPTHGFGSFCSATPTTGGASTIGAQRRSNLALTSDEDEFVKGLMAGLTAYPRYYAHMGPANRSGPAAPDLTAPRRADPAELRRRIDAGEWVVDLRQRRAFAAGHISGTISVELGDPFATYLGWTMPWGQPLTLIGDHSGQVADACRQLVRIGVDQLAAAAAGPTGDLADGRMGRYDVRDFPALAGRVAHGRPGRAGRAPPRRVARRPPARRGAHPVLGAGAAGRRGPGGRGLGALRQRLPGLHRRLAPGPRRPAGGARGRRLGPRRAGRPADHHRGLAAVRSLWHRVRQAGYNRHAAAGGARTRCCAGLEISLTRYLSPRRPYR